MQGALHTTMWPSVIYRHVPHFGSRLPQPGAISMLVVRAWLAAEPSRVRRLKHLVALAPASFGSLLAKKGRARPGCT